MLIIGLMSGTSLDGVDAALVELRGTTRAALEWRVVHAVTHPFDSEQRAAIHHGMVAGNARALCRLDAELGEWLAEAAQQVCREAHVALAEVAAIGSHGQTLWHEPPTVGRRGATLQLGDAATIAERTGCAVVSNFRVRDMAAGGHGAPLVPWVDETLFAVPERARALQNIGGIGNVTRVPPRGSEEPLLAFDTGPGNALIDAAVERATSGRLTYDRDGALAARGEVDQRLLGELLAHPYFGLHPPKSTGRETFGSPFVTRLCEALEPEGDADWLDLVATLTELTARSIADSYERWLLPLGLDEVIVTGGGALNPTLMARLVALLDPVPVRGGAALGVEPGIKEAVAFAVLAWAHLHRLPGNVVAATGAAGPRVLGSYTPGAAGREPF